MTAEEQIEFVRQLTDVIAGRCIGNIQAGQVPAEWDGHELRRWVADIADECVIGRNMRDGRTRRMRAYHNTRYVNNI